jgi:ADP-ribosylglycohydrolase
MSTTSSIADRAAGCIVGAFIGDALGLGPHWYYDLAELQREYGAWIDDYTSPRPDHYHGGMSAGELSQTGIIMELLLQSVAARGQYDEKDFCRRLDEDFLPHLDGKPSSGPGGYTNHSFRHVWTARVQNKLPWGQTAGNSDTSEGAERIAIIAARYAHHPRELAQHAAGCCRLAQNDSLVVQQSVAFGLVLAALIRGEKFDEQLSGKLMVEIKRNGISFVSEHAPAPDATEYGMLAFASPDAILLPSWIARAARDPAIRIEPAWKVSLIYGMSCAINYVLPAAYYLAARYPGDFENAVLHAINGGGQNMSRACLAGALAGAESGLSGIPRRFIDGLQHGKEIRQLAEQVASSSNT